VDLLVRLCVGVNKILKTAGLAPDPVKRIAFKPLPNPFFLILTNTNNLNRFSLFFQEVGRILTARFCRYSYVVSAAGMSEENSRGNRPFDCWPNLKQEETIASHIPVLITKIRIDPSSESPFSAL
jgi:hypothetical protein